MLNLLRSSYLPLILALMLFASYISRIAMPPIQAWTEKRIMFSIAERGLIWSCCVYSPIVFFSLYLGNEYPLIALLVLITWNWMLHLLLEDLYYRTKTINYRGLKFYNILQIFLIWLIYIVGY